MKKIEANEWKYLAMRVGNRMENREPGTAQLSFYADCLYV